MTGLVTSEDLGPLPGVNIVIQGSAQGAVTDVNGTYSINVPGPDAVLLFSCIEQLKSRSVINRSLTRFWFQM